MLEGIAYTFCLLYLHVQQGRENVGTQTHIFQDTPIPIKTQLWIEDFVETHACKLLVVCTWPAYVLVCVFVYTCGKSRNGNGTVRQREITGFFVPDSEFPASAVVSFCN